MAVTFFAGRLAVAKSDIRYAVPAVFAWLVWGAVLAGAHRIIRERAKPK